MIRVIEDIILGEETIEEHKMIKNKLLDRNIEVTMVLVILIGIEAGQKMNNVQVILEGMVEVTLGEDQVLEKVAIETKLDASNAGNMIIVQL